ncbi:hypothetical protein Pmani_017884 [Petrolisthes manimaculis]|uniref:C2H2-type domain-containing protein n=1 Tax=Petrolisthes manimaculis TaxID=1843537 RepID=A0AAE1PLA2_9EUCA|nr:hypothetical protein Pmani_017884 [Petrolisthes manimaculis]
MRLWSFKITNTDFVIMFTDEVDGGEEEGETTMEGDQTKECGKGDTRVPVNGEVVAHSPSPPIQQQQQQERLVGDVPPSLPLTPLTTTNTNTLERSAKCVVNGTTSQVSSPSAIALLTTVTTSANLKRIPGRGEGRRERGQGEEEGSVGQSQGRSNKEAPYTCPVCQEVFKSKRSFNAHIIVHCQLVNGSTGGSKRQLEVSVSPSPEKKRVRENSESNLVECIEEGYLGVMEEGSSVPLDLSCRGPSTDPHPRPAAASTPELPQEELMGQGRGSADLDHSDLSLKDTKQTLNHSIISDRGPLEDENENLVNEAREREKAFFNTAQNEQYLTEDSTGLDPPPPLPLYGPGGCVRKVRVSSDDGPPMVYSVRLHAEQVLVTRILGVNDETGDKMELYKCFLCGVAFPSVSRLQAHLSHHKQRFMCSKCNFSCDSRVQFSYHVQREHLSPVTQSQREGSEAVCELSDDSSSAENTVTVAALLSALREKAQASRSQQTEDDDDEEEEEQGSEDSYPISPSSETQETGDQGSGGGGGGGRGTGEELFKMYNCRYCGKKFDRAFSCNRHERVHTGYKPCFCRVCGRGFSEPRNLRHHVIRFHSDGSLRHLIKRDRRGKRDDDSPTPSLSPVPLRYPETPTRLKDMLKETANKLISSSNIDMMGLSGKTTGLEISLTGKASSGEDVGGSGGKEDVKPPSSPQGETATGKDQSEDNDTVTTTTYTTSLTRIIAASLDSSPRGTRRPPTDTPRVDELEPGEIRLDRRTRIVDDGELGRRLVVADDAGEDPLDHSPHFSNYAPRLNIVQEPIDRDKALLPITDDIGRTFFECPYCRKLFGSTSDMNRHLDFHEDLRPYNCEYCDYSARTNSQLKVHKMRHEGIKLYSCDVCNYNGVTQSDLNRHKKTQSHIARSKNVCSMCGLGFYTGSQKQVHVVQCHPEVEGASSLIQMSLGPPVAPILPPTTEYSPLTQAPPPAPTPPSAHPATATAQ